MSTQGPGVHRAQGYIAITLGTRRTPWLGISWALLVPDPGEHLTLRTFWGSILDPFCGSPRWPRLGSPGARLCLVDSEWPVRTMTASLRMKWIMQEIDLPYSFPHSHLPTHQG